MKQWFERGGWILVMAVIIFLSFCMFAQVYLGEDSGVYVPLVDGIDLFAYTVYASEEYEEFIPEESEDPPEVEETETPEDAPEEPELEDSSEETKTEESSPEPPPGETEPADENQENSQYDEPYEFDGFMSDFNRSEEKIQESLEIATDNELLASIDYNLRVISGGVVLAICAAFTWYMILKPLKNFIF